jgi:hypothetical protein
MKITGELLRAHYNLNRIFEGSNITLADAYDALKNLRKLEKHRSKINKKAHGVTHAP